jgi:glycosyltransferase involved in cell wall biosynthesis
MINVLQISTHNEDCGIAKYQEQFVNAMSKHDDYHTDFFPYSPNVTKNMSKQDFRLVLDKLKESLINYDILHIQHELSFFKHNELSDYIEIAKLFKIKVIVTVHTAPHAQFITPRLRGLGLKSIMQYLKQSISSRRFINRFVKPLKSADLIIVHNKQTVKSLNYFGVKEEYIKQIKIPVPVLNKKNQSGIVSKNLRKNKNDIIYCTVGFMSRMKGIDHAIRALCYLPDNYKLVIIGGNHPDTLDGVYYDELCDLITRLKLGARVYITGYIKEDESLNAAIRETDICVYPFDSAYYSYVSSASLNNAFANHLPAIAYPTNTFLEINESDPGTLSLCASGNYYELARKLKNTNIKSAIEKSTAYSTKYSYENETNKLLDIYNNLVKINTN